ncbi:MAG: fumarylacetoacetate hydrolase family protein [Gracilibacteraceae bacterium]|jgi:2-keto-4-pentenoate hydratase/2-oxohepta-3-ene-1,7-dioic acid hydratase in catechol pathway|nr:fumarylacetoacetate hydrolase family protein [Gracilibacteraceae bacterium]
MAEEQLFSDKLLPKTLAEVIDHPQALERLNIIALRQSELDGACVVPLAQVGIEAPLPEPKRNIICIGLNYREHAVEFNAAMQLEENIPKTPIVFTKANTAVVGPESDIKPHSHLTVQLDYEAELAVIIGKEGTAIREEDAFDYIFGYTIINDVTARDLQKKHSQWFIGKSLNTFAPLGPYLVTKDEIEWPVQLDIQCRVNGELRGTTPPLRGTPPREGNHRPHSFLFPLFSFLFSLSSLVHRSCC